MLEIARRLDIGRLAVYSMLEQGIIPGAPPRPAVDHHATGILDLGEHLRRPAGHWTSAANQR